MSYDHKDLLERLELQASVDHENLSNRNRPFAFAHMGHSSLAVGALLRAIKETKDLVPPRTGHIGNWDDLLDGRSGALDFNKAVFRSGAGYPLIFAFTQTEAEGGSGGDRVYLPGSRREGDELVPLPLHTWNGERFEERSRENPLFCPFTVTQHHGSLATLVEIHRERLDVRLGEPSVWEADVLFERSDELRSYLKTIIEGALLQPNVRRALQDVLSHAVSLSGEVARAEIDFMGGEFHVNGYRYESLDALMEAVLVPLRAVREPRWFIAEVSSLPPILPLISTLATSLFSAAFGSHLRGASGHAADRSLDYSLHLHWGARDMAGYPPARKGYFAERSTQKSLKWMSDRLVAGQATFPPVCFVLLPAAIFMLCPPDSSLTDVERMSGLFAHLLECRSKKGSVSLVESDIKPIVQAWAALNAPSLGDYFRARFRARSGLRETVCAPTKSDPVFPSGFEELTLVEACTVVGCLMEVL